MNSILIARSMCYQWSPFLDYYIRDRVYWRYELATWPIKVSGTWIWFSQYYQWYSYSTSIKGSHHFKSLKTLNRIETLGAFNEDNNLSKKLKTIIKWSELYGV